MKKVILFFIFFITIAAVNITTVTTGMQLVNDVIKARQGPIEMLAGHLFSQILRSFLLEISTE